jgi:glycosyltransferase involved in cell wall biosynthesis
MKILHLSAGNLEGGAARGAYWLHRALLDQGCDSNFLSQHGEPNEDEHIYTSSNTALSKISSKLLPRIDQLPLKLYPDRHNFIFSPGLFGINLRKVVNKIRPDILHLHWINAGLVDIRQLKSIDCPIVWTMRDMWPFTGGCHYSFGCEGYKRKCGNCPQLNSRSSRDLSNFVLHRKKRYYPEDIVLIAISNWQAECAMSSSIFSGKQITMIPNGVNHREFFPVDKSLAREALGLPKDKEIVLIGAQNIQDPYKGFPVFLQALECIEPAEKTIVLFGRSKGKRLEMKGFDPVSLGFLRDAISLRLAYSAADVFVAPSIEEAFGKTIVESMACGTPVVAFDATGPRDIVEHLQSGYLAKPFDPGDLAAGINWVLGEKERKVGLSKNAAFRAREHYDIEMIANKHIDLYKSIYKK